jgi:transcriptional regulator with XRE-family HTH domain
MIEIRKRHQPNMAITKLRKLLGVSRGRLAMMLNWSHQYIQAIEFGFRGANRNVGERICNKFGVSVSSILDGLTPIDTITKAEMTKARLEMFMSTSQPPVSASSVEELTNKIREIFDLGNSLGRGQTVLAIAMQHVDTLVDVVKRDVHIAASLLIAEEKEDKLCKLNVEPVDLSGISALSLVDKSLIPTSYQLVKLLSAAAQGLDDQVLLEIAITTYGISLDFYSIITDILIDFDHTSGRSLLLPAGATLLVNASKPQ